MAARRRRRRRSPTAQIGKVKTISRAAAAARRWPRDHGRRTAGARCAPARCCRPAPSFAPTSARASSLELADGTRIVLDHRTSVAFDAREPRRIKLVAGRIAADVAHVDESARRRSRRRRAAIDVVGTRFSVTATDAITAVQVVRGAVVLDATRRQARRGPRRRRRHDRERQARGQRGAAARQREAEWSELGTEARSRRRRDAARASARCARTSPARSATATGTSRSRITTSRSASSGRSRAPRSPRRSATTATRQLEGVYQFPLPADAQIDSLALDMENGPVASSQGAFVDKERAREDLARRDRQGDAEDPDREPLIQQEIVWVPGPWSDPALLDWKRGGRFELRIFPIPAKGARTIKLAYTQVVTPRGPWRQYVYPLPHSTDGSTVADKMKVDVEVRGAQPGLGPRGRLRADARSGARRRQRADARAGRLRAARRPRRSTTAPPTVTPRSARGRSPAARPSVPTTSSRRRRTSASTRRSSTRRRSSPPTRARPRCSRCRPKLPRWRESKPRDYMIVIDSQPVDGRRAVHPRERARGRDGRQMDRRDRFSVMACDSECRTLGDMRAPSAVGAGELKSWLAAQTPAGASDVVAARACTVTPS